MATDDWITMNSTYSNAVVRYEYPGVGIPPIQVAANHHRQHKGLVTTNAVKTRAGWLGQVLVDQKIVWESESQDEREDALKLADARVANALGDLFA